MITLQEQRLAMFVDRVAEMAHFCEMLEGNNKPIMVVWGDIGIGKTSLMARMVHECAQRKKKKSEVVWTDTRNHNYRDIMGKIRDDVGGNWFNAYTDLYNYFNVPNYEFKISSGGGQFSVANGAQITNSTTGDIAGVIIKQLFVTVPRADLDVPENEQKIRLTDQFIKCLAAATLDEPLVIFFDAVEKMSEDTEKWISDELVMSLSEGKLPNVRLVLFGQKKPQLGECWLFAEETELKPLGKADIVEYLGKRGVEEGDRNALADMLLVITKGRLQEVANYVEGYVNLQRRAQGT